MLTAGEVAATDNWSDVSTTTFCCGLVRCCTPQRRGVVVGVSDRDRLEGVIRGREGVAAISGLPAVRLTGVATGSSCLCIQQKENITIIGPNKQRHKGSVHGEVHHIRLTHVPTNKLCYYLSSYFSTLVIQMPIRTYKPAVTF
jgi:hypothetical protein